MSLQRIIDTAQSIEVIRKEVVAQTVTRSGKLLTGVRQTVKPWIFRVTPAGAYRWTTTERANLEAIMNIDRKSETTISLPNWLVAYQGSLTSTELANNLSISGVNYDLKYLNISVSGAALNKNTGTVFFRSGDVVQPAGTRYPYVVQNDYTHTFGQASFSLYVHRDIIGSPIGVGLRAGSSCEFKVLITELPSYKYSPGQIIEFSGDFGLTENVT
jgi:hypothetical protein